MVIGEKNTENERRRWDSLVQQFSLGFLSITNNNYCKLNRRTTIDLFDL